LRRVVLGLGLEGLGAGAAVGSAGVTASAGASYGKGSDMGSPQGTDVLRTPKAVGGDVRSGGDRGHVPEKGTLPASPGRAGERSASLSPEASRGPGCPGPRGPSGPSCRTSARGRRSAGRGGRRGPSPPSRGSC